MWYWLECEDYCSSAGSIQVSDDWGAAAYRFVRLGEDASVSVLARVNPGGLWQIMLRCQNRLEQTASITVSIAGYTETIEIEPTGGRAAWVWKTFNARIPAGNHTVEIRSVCGSPAVDGLFITSERMELFANPEAIHRFVGPREAQQTLPGQPKILPEAGVTMAVSSVESPSEAVKKLAGSRWPVIEALASKPSPYIVKAYDTAGGTDYNADYSWHALHKEKLWEMQPHAGLLGVVNPNSDVYYTLGFSVDGGEFTHQPPDRTLVHLADTMIAETDLGDGLRAEVMLRCFSSHTLQTVVYVSNSGNAPRRLRLGEAISKGSLHNPPPQVYTAPRQKFGYGVETTAGGVAWQGASDDGATAAVCFYEWIRNRSRGRRLLVTLASETGGSVDFGPCDPSSNGVGVIYKSSPEKVIQPGQSVELRSGLDMRRFTLFDTWAPELTPDLYRQETEEEAITAGLDFCTEVIGSDWKAALEESIRPYQAFPFISLPEKRWEADWYSCIELIRASTFSPLGEMPRPFYNFCRVHAHEPFNWWSYGMHAHESLIALFQNFVNPSLSADFLRGHIIHQTPEGRYPYGVSHTINPRTRTEEATLPVLVWEMWQTYLWSGDRDFLAEAFESGKRSHEWYLRTRDRCGEGLCHYLNFSYETSRDDNGLPTWALTGGAMHQEALDLNCFLLTQEWTLCSMASELGQKDQAERFRDMAIRRSKLMNACMWHEDDRVYYGIGEVIPGWADVKDISTFYPLWAGLAPDGRHETIAEHAGNPETFGTPFGPPTLAKNEPMFSPEGHWFGSNWVEVTLFVLLGLKRYGYYRQAANLALQNTKMVFDVLEREGHFREYFNSETGEGVDLVDYNWTAIPAYYIVAVMFGLEPEADGVSIMPALPDGWDEISIRELSIRGRKLSVIVKRWAGVSETKANVNGKPVEVKGNRGVFIRWSQMPGGLTEVEIIQPETLPDAPKAPPEAPSDWSDVEPHRYPNDPELIAKVRELMKPKDALWDLPKL